MTGCLLHDANFPGSEDWQAWRPRASMKLNSNFDGVSRVKQSREIIVIPRNRVPRVLVKICNNVDRLQCTTFASLELVSCSNGRGSWTGYVASFWIGLRPYVNLQNARFKTGVEMSQTVKYRRLLVHFTWKSPRVRFLFTDRRWRKDRRGEANLRERRKMK